MSTLHDNVIQQEAQIIGQALLQIRTQIETLAIVHFQTSAHPINGLADKFTEFHKLVVSASASHDKYLASIQPNPILGPVASAAQESNVTEFPKPEPDPTEER
jgi:hypothetical protein